MLRTAPGPKEVSVDVSSFNYLKFYLSIYFCKQMKKLRLREVK